MESFKFSSVFVTAIVKEKDLSFTEFGVVISHLDFDGLLDGEGKAGCAAADEELTTATVSSDEQALSCWSPFRERIK